MVKVITLTVTDAFDDRWSMTADAEVATRILQIAGDVYDLVSSRASTDVPDATRELIETVVSAQHERRVRALEETLAAREAELAALREAKRNLEGAHQVEECKWAYETEKQVSEKTAEARRAFEQATSEASDLRRVHEQLTSTMNDQLDRMRGDIERRVATEGAQHVSSLQSRLEERTLENVELERRLGARATEASELREAHACELAKMRERIVELETPMGRGRAGELDVAQSLRDVGLQVVDTSMGEAKEAGFLDLLVHPDGAEENMRVAIEMKNVREVQKRDRDEFERKVSEGVARNLFDAAIFISIRAHTKMGGPVILRMFPDEGNRPLVPVTWLGPERAKSASPLTQEQVETHVFMMLALLAQCHTIRRELCNGLRDEHVERIQCFVDAANLGFNDTFVDLAKQSKLIDDLRANLTALRARCIGMYAALWSVNRNVPWLSRPGVHTPWMDVFQTARQKMDASVKEADIWNECSKKKVVVERSIGKDAMFVALREDRKRRARTEEEENAAPEGES